MPLTPRYCGLAHVSNFPYLSTQLQDAASPSPEHFQQTRICITSVLCLVYCSRQIVSWTADSSNKSDILPSVTLGTRHHVCVQLSRKYRRCIRSIKNIKIQQPAACNLTINQGTKPPSCGTMSAQTQLSTRPDSADSAARR